MAARSTTRARWNVAIACTLTLAIATPAAPLGHASSNSSEPLETAAVTFVNASLGWRLAAHWDGVRGLYGPLLVGRTRDGGSTWRTIVTIPDGMVRQQGEEGYRVSSLRFASAKDGWAYGTALYATHDGGFTWKALPTVGRTTEISVVGSSAWRLDERCENVTCRDTLLTSSVGSDRWRPAAVQPFGTSSTHASARGGTLIRANASVAWLLADENPATGRIAQLLLGTRDGGRTWHALATPCGTQGSVGEVMAAYGSKYLWSFCAMEPSAGEELKTVTRSNDGGNHWRVVSASGQYGLHNISPAGYVSDAALTSPSSAWLALGRGTLLHTSNGGHTWRDAIPRARANPGDGGVGPVLFTDSRHGWLLSFPYLLFRTVDGGHHWHRIQLS